MAAYQAAAKSGLVKNKAVLDAATAFAGHHQQHGDAFKAAGTNPNVAANKAVLDMVTPQLTAAKTENDVVALAYGLENAAAATYIFALGVLTNDKAYNAVASVMPVEAQHAVALGSRAREDRSTTRRFMPSFETMDRGARPRQVPGRLIAALTRGRRTWISTTTNSARAAGPRQGAPRGHAQVA